MRNTEEILRSTLHDPDRQPPVNVQMLEIVELHGRRLRRRRAISAIAASVLGVAAVVGGSMAALTSGHEDRTTQPAASNAVSAPLSPIQLTGYPVSMATDATDLYVLQTGPNGVGATVQRVDRSTHQITQTSATAALPGDASQIIRGSGNNLWVLTRQGQNEPASANGIWLLDAKTLQVERNVSRGTYFYGFTLGGGRVWAGGPYTLYGFDESTGKQTNTVTLPYIGVTPVYAAQAGVVDVRDVGGAADNFATVLYSFDSSSGTQLATRDLHMSEDLGVGPLVSAARSTYFLELSGDGTGGIHRVDARTLQDEPTGSTSLATVLGGSQYSAIYAVNDALLVFNQSNSVLACTSATEPGPATLLPGTFAESTVAAVAGDQTGMYVAGSDGRVLPVAAVASCPT